MKRNKILPLSAMLSLSLHSFAQSGSCLNGLFLCSNDQLQIQEIPSQSDSRRTSFPCLPTDAWPNSITFFWQMAYSSDIEYSILPNNPIDDIDFILYRIDDSGQNCSNWTTTRCMAAGPRLATEDPLLACTGETGLSKGSNSAIHFPGCDEIQGNFLSAVPAKSDELYALTIMNFTSFSGFLIEFSEDMKFKTTSDLQIEMASIDPAQTNILTTGCLSLVGEDNTVIIQNPNIVENIHIYPNPVSDNLTVKVINCRLASYHFVNVQGQEFGITPLDPTVQNELLNIRTTDLSSGLYLVRFESVEGHMITRSFVKE